MSTPLGGGMQLPNLFEVRIYPGLENTPEQRRKVLAFTVQHARGRDDLLELVDMLGLDVNELRSAS